MFFYKSLLEVTLDFFFKYLESKSENYLDIVLFLQEIFSPILLISRYLTLKKKKKKRIPNSLFKAQRSIVRHWLNITQATKRDIRSAIFKAFSPTPSHVTELQQFAQKIGTGSVIHEMKTQMKCFSLAKSRNPFHLKCAAIPRK